MHWSSAGPRSLIQGDVRVPPYGLASVREIDGVVEIDLNCQGRAVVPAVFRSPRPLAAAGTACSRQMTEQQRPAYIRRCNGRRRRQLPTSLPRRKSCALRWSTTSRLGVDGWTTWRSESSSLPCHPRHSTLLRLLHCWKANTLRHPRLHHSRKLKKCKGTTGI